MKTATNINFNSERKFEDIQEASNLCYSEADWNLTFDYNGIKLFAVIDFSVNLYECGDKETNSIYLDVFDVDVFIHQLLDEDDLVFELTTKQEIALTNQLQIELKTEF